MATADGFTPSKVVPTRTSIIVTNPDLNYLSGLKAASVTSRVEILAATTMQDAQELLINKKQKQVMGIFISQKLGYRDWLGLIKSAHLNMPTIPIFIIENPELKDSLNGNLNLNSLGVSEILQHNVAYDTLVQKLSLHDVLLEKLNIFDHATLAQNVVRGIVSNEDLEYVPVRVDRFISGTKSLYDIYIRLKTGRYLKLSQAGDAFAADRLASYINKGVMYFYIKKDVQEDLVIYCDSLATDLIESKTTPRDIALAQTFVQGEETIRFLSSLNVPEEKLKYAISFLNNVQKISSQIPLSESKIFQIFMKNIALYSHATGTTMLSGMLAQHLKINTQESLHAIGIASMFHDISLASMPQSTWDEDESKMSADDLFTYRKHPQLSAEVFMKHRAISSLTIQAILQHHMRIGGVGFPERTGTTMVNQLSEILGICDEFQNMIHKRTIIPKLDLEMEIVKKIEGAFSKPVTDGFLQLFFKK